MPNRITVPVNTVDCDQGTQTDGELFWIEAYCKISDEFPLESKFHLQKFDSVYVVPADYRDGFITFPRAGNKSIVRQSYYKKGHEKIH